MICNTAVKDVLLERNPCDVRSAINPKVRKKVKIPATVELHAIADKLGADPRYERFKALVLLAGWCECVSVRSRNCAAGWRANPRRFGTCESDRLDLVPTRNTVCHNVIHDQPAVTHAALSRARSGPLGALPLGASCPVRPPHPPATSAPLGWLRRQQRVDSWRCVER
jgi:hypothetical protein